MIGLCVGLFIYGLFNDAISSSYYRASIDRINEYELERCGKKWS
jgi:hypothetical protein